MKFSELGKAVIENEAQAVAQLLTRMDHHFDAACELILACQGRVIVTGMGKSGHIANKIAATLSSTGTPAFFMHPGEASHGDLGMVTAQDLIIAISHSGNTQELLVLLPIIRRLNIPLITLTGHSNSILASAARVHLDVSIDKEACPLGLAPTTSTTVALAMGDALAVAVLQVKGFSANDFALSHPGGILGRRLLLEIDELWNTGPNLPVTHEGESIREALIEVTSKKLGMTCVVNDQGLLSGVFTDGDIRRSLSQDQDIKITPLTKVMTRDCLTIQPGLLAVEALSMMQQHRISSLVVIDEEKRPKAVVHLQDLLRAGLE